MLSLAVFSSSDEEEEYTVAANTAKIRYIFDAKLNVCDHKLQIKYIASHYPGSVYDSLVWNANELKQFLKQNYSNGDKNTWLLGATGYPLDLYLIAPFRSAGEDSPESKFNYVYPCAD